MRFTHPILAVVALCATTVANAQWNSQDTARRAVSSASFDSVAVASRGAEASGGEVDAWLERESSTFSVGASLGDPAGANLSAAFRTKYVGIRLSGGAWGSNWSGAQADLSAYLLHSSTMSIGISVSAGRFSTYPIMPDDQQRHVQAQSYFGVAYDMTLAGFFLQAGAVFGNGDYPPSQFLYQIGYLVELF